MVVWFGKFEHFKCEIASYYSEDDWKKRLKDDILDVLRKHKIKKIGFSHYPEFAPSGLFQYVTLVYNSTDFNQSHRSLRKLCESNACFDAVIGGATNVMLETKEVTTAREKRALIRQNAREKS